jgi:hypothetical protein
MASVRRRNRSTSPVPTPQPLPAPSNEPDTTDVEFLLGQTAEWIRAADTKAGLLLAALTVLLGGISSSARDLKTLWSGHHVDRLDALIVLAASVALLAVAYALLIAVLLPRRSSPADSRYAWPWVNSASLLDLERLTPDSRRTEAWRQAKQLAAIAARKHCLFTAAVWFSSGSVACFLAWSVLRY